MLKFDIYQRKAQTCFNNPRKIFPPKLFRNNCVCVGHQAYWDGIQHYQNNQVIDHIVSDCPSTAAVTEIEGDAFLERGSDGIVDQVRYGNNNSDKPDSDNDSQNESSGESPCPRFTDGEVSLHRYCRQCKY